MVLTSAYSSTQSATTTMTRVSKMINLRYSQPIHVLSLSDCLSLSLSVFTAFV